MASLPIHWIEVRTYCHATEEEDRVARALEAACRGGDTKREILEGHFGNPLVRLTRRADEGWAIRAIWDSWSYAGLPAALAKDLEARVDEEGILHFRIDKQSAYRERLALARDADAIDVRLKLMAFPARPDEARRIARSILEGAQ